MNCFATPSSASQCRGLNRSQTQNRYIYLSVYAYKRHGCCRPYACGSAHDSNVSGAMSRDLETHDLRRRPECSIRCEESTKMHYSKCFSAYSDATKDWRSRPLIANAARTCAHSESMEKDKPFTDSWTSEMGLDTSLKSAEKRKVMPSCYNICTNSHEAMSLALVKEPLYQDGREVVTFDIWKIVRIANHQFCIRAAMSQSARLLSLLLSSPTSIPTIAFTLPCGTGWGSMRISAPKSHMPVTQAILISKIKRLGSDKARSLAWTRSLDNDPNSRNAMTPRRISEERLQRRVTSRIRSAIFRAFPFHPSPTHFVYRLG